jgi:glycosyltransferase involved in cell wall biosynthesis
LKKKIVILASNISSINIFLKKLILSFNYELIDIHIISDSIPDKDKLGNTNYHKTNFVRNISIISDIKNLFQTFFLFRSIKPDLSISITPKAGLVNSIVSIFFKNKSLHIFTGQVWYNKKGIFKIFLKYIDLIIFYLVKNIFADSQSQINFLFKEGFKSKNIKLILNGSICGVDIEKFKTNKNVKYDFKKSNFVDTKYLVIGYIGRLNSDKGINLLLDAFKKLSYNNKNLLLILVGKDENNYVNLINEAYSDLNIKYYNFTNNPEKFYQIFDIFCIPSYREGFGLSALEASASSLPVVASNIVGLKDSILNNITGKLFKVGDIQDLISSLDFFIYDKQARLKFGANGRQRVKDQFKDIDVIADLKKSIIKILN